MRPHQRASRTCAMTLCALAAIGVAVPPARALPTQLSANEPAWVQAAQSRRADVWILGDSIGSGLDTGFNHAAASR